MSLLPPPLRGEAPGAIPNGTRIVKTAVDGDGDMHAIGAMGTVISSIATPPEVLRRYPHISHSYFVEWDDMPGIAGFVIGTKIGRLT